MINDALKHKTVGFSYYRRVISNKLQFFKYIICIHTKHYYLMVIVTAFQSQLSKKSVVLSIFVNSQGLQKPKVEGNILRKRGKYEWIH